MNDPKPIEVDASLIEAQFHVWMANTRRRLMEDNPEFKASDALYYHLIEQDDPWKAFCEYLAEKGAL